MDAVYLKHAIRSLADDFPDLGARPSLPENKFDEKKYYGKHIFADGVVAKHTKTINFSGFKPLLTNICTVIKGHSQN